MKKKVFLNGRFLTRPLSGVQRTAFELVKALDELIDQNTIPGDDTEFYLIYSGEIINPIILKRIRLLKKGVFTGNIWEQLELPVYTYGHLLINMCSIAPVLKTRQFLIVHDASFLVNPGFFSKGFRAWYKFAIPRIGRRSRQIITVSQFSKKELAKHGPIDSDKISVIYNAADHILKYEEPGEEFKAKINTFKPYCLSVSSLGVNKNFLGLSKALQKVDFKGYHMLIAGGVMDTLKYQAPESSVTYLGYVSNEELKYLYNNASLFIFPSFYEGFGIPPLEAMVSGCPVIASNTSSMPEVLEDACAYFDPHDVDHMAQKISSLLHNKKELAELKQKGYARSAAFSWKQSGSQLYNLMARLNV